MAKVKMTPQPFDTEILGGPVYRAEVTSVAQVPFLGASIPKDAILVSARVPPNWSNVMEATTEFREIERLVSFECPLTPADGGPLPEGIRRACREDANACADIAGRCFSFDRLHTDPWINTNKADESKRTWALNNILWRAEANFVAEFRGRIVGFNLCRQGGDWALIDLIAVAPEAQGLGLGKTLVRAAIVYFAERVPVLRVGTQIANEASIAIYAANGFTQSEEMVTYHWTPGAKGSIKARAWQ